MHGQAVTNSVSGILPDGNVHASHMVTMHVTAGESKCTPSHVSTECKLNVTHVSSTTDMTPPVPSVDKAGM